MIYNIFLIEIFKLFTHIMIFFIFGSIYIFNIIHPSGKHFFLALHSRHPHVNCMCKCPSQHRSTKIAGHTYDHVPFGAHRRGFMNVPIGPPPNKC